MIEKAASTVAGEVGEGDLRADEVGADVHRPGAVEVGHCGVANRSAHLDADVRPRCLEPAERLHRLLERVGERHGVAGVDRERDRVGLGRDPRQRFSGHVQQREPPPGAAQPAGAGGADAGGGADDQHSSLGSRS